MGGEICEWCELAPTGGDHQATEDEGEADQHVPGAETSMNPIARGHVVEHDPDQPDEQQRHHRRRHPAGADLGRRGSSLRRRVKSAFFRERDLARRTPPLDTERSAEATCGRDACTCHVA